MNDFADDASPIERIKRVDSDGNEFWSARALMPLLGYVKWDKFRAVCYDAYSALCIENPNQIDLLPSSITVEIGFGALREIEDWRLSYLAVERVLSRAATYKPQARRELDALRSSPTRIEIEIGAALFEFCEQARLPIVHQKRVDDYIFDYCIDNRLLIEIDELHHEIDVERKQQDRIKTYIAMEENYQLLRIRMPIRSIVKVCGLITRMLIGDEEMVNTFSDGFAPISFMTRAGVITPEDFAIFQNHGYKGLYNGLAAEDIHRRKKLKKSQQILDHMGTTELAANLFRSTQAEDKLRRDNIQGKETANQVHYQAGVIVRRAIQEMGGTMPEDLPAVDSIKKIETAERKRLAAPKTSQKNNPSD
jgi:very-short-patch-repair endonuclease